MAKKVETGEIVSPANLWGKPLPRAPGKPTATTEEGKAARMLPDKDKIDSYVDAELEEDEPTDAELIDEESADDVYDEVSTVEASGDDEDDDADEDDDEFEAEDGDDDAAVSDVADDSDVDSAVDVDEVPVKASAADTPTKVVKKMAEKKSISDYVRDEIASRKASGDSLRGVDIVNALAKRRITVSPAQVSQLLKKAGISQKARGPRKAVAATASEERSRAALKSAKAAPKAQPRQQAPKVRATAATTTELPWKQLNAAKAFIAACDGSFESAADALAMFRKIETVLHN
jgi:hypothetical protein